MALLALAGMLLVTLAAFSAGAALAARGRGVLPRTADLAAALLLFAALAFVLPVEGKWLRLAVAVPAGLAAGALGAPFRRGGLHLAEADGGAWRRFALRMGSFQGRLLLGLLYFTVVTPFALIYRLIGGDPLAARGEDGSLWRARPAPAAGLDEARGQG